MSEEINSQGDESEASLTGENDESEISTTALENSENTDSVLEKINEEDELSISEDLFDSISSLGRTRCRFSVSGCPFRLPSMEEHELRECKFRPARCPSLTCPVRPPFAKLLRHIDVSFILNCTEKPFSPERNFLRFLSKQKKVLEEEPSKQA